MALSAYCGSLLIFWLLLCLLGSTILGCLSVHWFRESQNGILPTILSNLAIFVVSGGYILVIGLIKVDQTPGLFFLTH